MNEYNLVPFDRNFLISPFGMYNSSTMCYFNSMIQSILSCPSVVEYILKVKDLNGSNLILQILGRMITDKNKMNNNLSANIEYNLSLFNEFLRQLKQKSPSLNFGFNQEDSGEMFIILLDLLNDNYINNIFQHTYKCNIFCLDCRKSKDIIEDTGFYFTVDFNELKNNSLSSKFDPQNLNELNKFIRNNFSIFSQMKCESCSSFNIIKTNRLVIAPTVIMIVFNKYKEKINYSYPSDMSFINKLESSRIDKHQYRIVSSIHHNGNMNFGHYYSKCLRKPGVYNLNDTSITESNLSPESNSYIVLYHYVDTVEVF
jgi:ubiquitin C-terminal hydrolase